MYGIETAKVRFCFGKSKADNTPQILTILASFLQFDKDIKQFISRFWSMNFWKNTYEKQEANRKCHSLAFTFIFLTLDDFWDDIIAVEDFKHVIVDY